LWPVAFTTLILGYALVLHASPLWITIYLLAISVTAVIRLVVLIGALVSPPAELRAEGVRVRSSAFSMTLASLSWSEVSHAWITYVGGRRHLGIVTVRRDRPYFLPAPERSAPRESIDSALRGLSGDRIALADGPPVFSGGWDPDTAPRRAVPALRFGRERPTARWVRYVVPVVLFLLLPVLARAQQPWNQPWWPGVESATSAPDPCAAVDATTRQRLALTGVMQQIGGRTDTTCGLGGIEAAMTVRYRVAIAVLGSSRAAAVKLADGAMSADGTQPVPGLGDAARISATRPDAGPGVPGVAHLVARRANVVLEINYQGVDDPDLSGLIVRVARQAIAALDVH
jgi:hypothetical protein